MTGTLQQEQLNEIRELVAASEAASVCGFVERASREAKWVTIGGDYSMSRNQPKLGRQPHRGRSKGGVYPPVIDNRRFPSTDELAKLFKVPAARVRRLKELAAEAVKATETVR